MAMSPLLNRVHDRNRGSEERNRGSELPRKNKYDVPGWPTYNA